MEIFKKVVPFFGTTIFMFKQELIIFLLNIIKTEAYCL